MKNICKDVLIKCFYKTFVILKIIPVNKKKIILINGHSNLFNGNIEAIYKEIKKNYKNYKLVLYTKSDLYDTQNKLIKRFINLIKINFDIFTSRFVIVNDYVSLFSKIKLRNSTEVIQVWHAGGAFKKFGKDSLQNINNIQNMKNCVACHSQYDKVMVSSEEVADIYANAFGIEKSKVLPLGLARADKFYDKLKIKDIKENFIKKYDEIKDKKVILYAPTYRDGEKKIFKFNLDFEYLYNSLSDEYMVITKMHPFIKKGVNIPYEFSDRIIDLSFEDIDDLMIVSDLLITDYSSIIFEYAIMEKPMIFFAYDLNKYNNLLRGFYYDYEKFVPGPIVKSTSEVVEAIKNDKWDIDKIKSFKKKFNGYNDGKATKRIVENILNNK